MSAAENLLKLMNLGVLGLESVMRTSDGFYLGRKNGDIGYNLFLGRPAPLHDGPGQRHTLAVWESLSESERADVLRIATNPVDGVPIPLREEFGVPC